MSTLFKKTMPELVAMQHKIQNDPRNRNPQSDSIFIYTKSARKRLSDISWAITHLLSESKTKPSSP